MEAREFQRFAEEAVRRGRPVDCRNAISRSYYAAFGLAAQLLRTNGVAISKGAQAHGEVARLLGLCGDKEIERVGAQLRLMRGQRNRADYDLRDAHVERRGPAETYVLQARRHIGRLEAAFADEGRRAGMVQAIQTRRRGMHF